MTALSFGIYPAATPLSGLLATLDADDLEAGSGLRVELNGTGSGRIVIHGDHAAVNPTNFARGNYVLVTDTDLGEAIGGFFLSEGEFIAVSRKEQGGRVLTFGGPGSLAYLGRAQWVAAPYVASGSGEYNGPRDDGLWHWFQDQYGDILKRAIDEAQDPDRPTDPIPALTYNFTSTTDSASDPWESFSDSDYTIPIGENYLESVASWMRLGLTILMTPDLELLAFQEEYGTDRSSAIFAAGKVRFVAGTNVVIGEAGDLKRGLSESPRVKRLWVRGSDTRPSTVREVADAGAPFDREGFLSYPYSADPAVLDDVGAADIALRQAETDRAIVTHIPGDDEANGLYTPGWPGGTGHYWLGDTVRLHTGTGSYDFNELNLRVAAISWNMRSAGDWDIVVELGASYYAISQPNIPGVASPGTGQCTCCAHGPSGPYESGAAPSLLLPRLYLTSSDAPGADTPVHSVWEVDNTISTRTLKTATDGTTVSPSANSWTVITDVVHYQGRYVLTGSVDFSGGSVRCQARAKARHGLGIGAQAHQSQMVVRLFDSGGTLKGTLLSPHEPTAIDSTEWPNEGTHGPTPPMMNMKFPATSRWVNAYGAPLEGSLSGVAGDLLVIEIGGRHISGQDGAAAGNAMAVQADQATDLPENEEWTTSADANSWVEFFGPGGDSFAGDDAPPASTDALGSIGTPGCCFAYCDHRHKAQVAGNTPITDEGGYFTSDNVEGALQEIGSGVAGGIAWFNVKNYGAIGDGTTDDTSAINDAIAALVAAGRGVLYFPAGDYKVTTTLTALSVPFIVRGDGSMSFDTVHASRVTLTSGAVDLFSATAKWGRFEHIALLSNSGGTPSAGAGVHVSSSYLEQKVDFEDMHIRGFYDGLDIQVGAQWVAHNIVITAPVRYGMRIRNTVNPDAGDWSISDCNIYSEAYDATSGIRIESSGGGKIVNTKINMGLDSKRFATGIDLSVAVTTVILEIVNCSVENFRTYGVRAASTAGSWRAITIVGCEFGPWGDADAVPISMSGAGGGTLAYVLINDIVALNDVASSARVVELNTIDHATIGQIEQLNFVGKLLTTACTNITDNTAGSVSDHGALTGLADDDHTQYTRKATLTTTGDIYYASAASTPARLGIGSTGQVLGVTGGVPAWQAPTSGIGEILIVDTPSTPLVFADLVQNEAQDDLVYADP